MAPGRHHDAGAQAGIASSEAGALQPGVDAVTVPICRSVARGEDLPDLAGGVEDQSIGSAEPAVSRSDSPAHDGACREAEPPVHVPPQPVTTGYSPLLGSTWHADSSRPAGGPGPVRGRQPRRIGWRHATRNSIVRPTRPFLTRLYRHRCRPTVIAIQGDQTEVVVMRHRRRTGLTISVVAAVVAAGLAIGVAAARGGPVSLRPT